MPKHTKEKSTFLFCLLSLLMLTTVHAEEVQAPANLFIQSNPINAAIFIDGEPLLEKTPALIRELTPGSHTIVLRKNGFAGAEKTVTLEEGVTSVTDFALSRGTIITELPDEMTVYLRTNEETLITGPFRLPEGRFDYHREGGSLYITPVYPKNELFTVTGTLLASSFTAAVIAAIIEIDKKGELFLPHSDGLIITEALTAVFGLTELALLLDKQSFYRNFRLHSTDTSALESESAKLFDTGRQSFSAGHLEDALSSYSELISRFPDSPLFPETLYRIAKIHIISGDTNLAASELNIILNNFPDAGIYDRSCRTLALLYYNSGDTSAAKAVIERMIFYDPIFSGTEAALNSIGAEKVIENWALNPEGQTE